MALEIGKIRNIGFVGHGGVGKTSLVEAILFATGDFLKPGDRVEAEVEGIGVLANTIVAPGR